MEFNQAYDPIRALKTSWTVLGKAPLPLLVGGGILLITGGGGGGGGGGDWGFDAEHERFDIERLWPIFAGIFLIFCCIGIAFFLISSWVEIGFANCVEEVARTGKGDIGTVFDGKGRFGSMVFARILCALISIAAALPFVAIVVGAVLAHEHGNLHENAAILLGIGGCLVWLIVFLYVTLGLALAIQAVALEGRTATDAIGRSWSLVSGHRLMLFLYLVVQVIFTLLGLCACCIGIFLTGTMARIAINESFLALTRGAGRAGWWIERQEMPAPQAVGWGSTPPSPTSTFPPPPPPPPSPSGST